jgi:threonine/homoserine/homoserine lactone efflux protein
MNIDLHSLWLVCLIYAAGLFSPGPNFLVIAQQALRGSRIEAIATAGGVVTVNALWASSSLLGLNFLFSLAPWVLALLRGAGAIYLLLLGVKLWRHANTRLAADPGSLQSAGVFAAFRAGLATNLSNVKGMAFYGAAFSVVAPSAARTATLWFALGLVLLLASAWYGLVAVMLSARVVAASSERWLGWVFRAGSMLMITLSVILVLDDRDVPF